MKTLWPRRLKLLVLVPHRDIQSVLRKYSESLFKAGFCGAYSFPWAAPLAVVSRPFSDDELKHCASVIREASSLSGGKINTVESSAAALDDCFLLFGPRLSIDIPEGAFGAAITHVFSPPVIGACVFSSDGCDTASIPPFPQFFFRAAAVANMTWVSYGLPNTDGGEFRCTWKIGKLCWLPRPKAKGRTT